MFGKVSFDERQFFYKDFHWKIGFHITNLPINSQGPSVSISVLSPHCKCFGSKNCNYRLCDASYSNMDALFCSHKRQWLFWVNSATISCTKYLKSTFSCNFFWESRKMLQLKVANLKKSSSKFATISCSFDITQCVI